MTQWMRATILSMWMFVSNHRRLALGTSALVGVVLLGWHCGPEALVKIKEPSTPHRTIYIQSPENLTGNEALSRGLESFDKVIASKIKKMTLSLFKIFDEIPHADRRGFSRIRLNGPDAKLATGAPVDHPLFEWLPPADNKKAPNIDVVRIKDADEKSKEDAYRVRFMGSNESDPTAAIARGSDGTKDSRVIIIEVSRERSHGNDTCRISKKIRDIFPQEGQVTLEPIFESVAACILSDHFRSGEYDKGSVPELFDLMFNNQASEDPVRATSAIQGIEQYRFFIEEWRSRPESAEENLNKAISYLGDALKTRSDQKNEEPDASSYPIIGYLYAHALISKITGPSGRIRARNDKNDLQNLERSKSIFALPPFTEAWTTRALAQDALSSGAQNNSKSSADAWKSLVKNLEVAENAEKLKKDGADQQKLTSIIRRRIAARTRLMFAYRNMEDETGATATREAITNDAKSIAAIDANQKNPDGTPVVDSDLVNAAFELDMAIDYLNVFLSATGKLEQIQLAPSILTASDSVEMRTIHTKTVRTDDDFCDEDMTNDADLKGYKPNLDTAAEACKADQSKCDEFRKEATRYLRFTGRRFLGGSFRKLDRARRMIRNARSSICDMIERVSECDDLQNVDTGNSDNEPNQTKPVRPSAQTLTTVRFLDDLEANISIVSEIFACYAPNFQQGNCTENASGSTVLDGGSTPTATAPTGPADAAPILSVAPSASTRADVDSPNKSNRPKDPEQRRWRRWIGRPNQRGQIITMRALCAVNQALFKQDRGKTIAKEMRYGALPEVWVESPPSSEDVTAAVKYLIDNLDLDTYRKNLPLHRAMFAYARLWQFIGPLTGWLRLDTEKTSKTSSCVNGTCTEQTLRDELDSVGRELLVFGKDHKYAGSTFADLGDALRETWETTTPNAEENAEIQKLVTCRGGSETDAPHSCILSEGLKTYAAWINGSSVDPSKPKAKARLEEAHRQARNTRKEIENHINIAYRRVATNFFNRVQGALASQSSNSLDIQTVRIALFRVLLFHGAPAVTEDDTRVLALRALQGMLTHTGDMKALALVAQPGGTGAVVRDHGFTRSVDGNLRSITDEKDAVEAIGSATSARDVVFGPCSSNRTLRQFLGYVRSHEAFYAPSWLQDPRPLAALDLNQSVQRWCELRGLSTLSEATVLRTLVFNDLTTTDAAADKASKGRDLQLARFVGSDDFLTYVYARYLFSNDDSQQSYALSLNMSHLEGKLLRARALLGNGQAAPAMVTATMAVREYESLSSGSGLVLDGAFYRTLADAALQTGQLGGLDKSSTGDGDGRRSPLPEYAQSAAAYRKAIARGSLEGSPDEIAGLGLRLAAASIESYDDDTAVRHAVPSGPFGSYLCHKWRPIIALARWARGEHDVARKLTGEDGEFTLFDVDQPMENANCPADKDPIPFGWRAKWLRQELLRDKSRQTVVTSQ